MKKIFILLPHKEKFSKKNSGSASIWVKDFFKPSKFRKNISVYGPNVIKKMLLLKEFIITLILKILNIKVKPVYT